MIYKEKLVGGVGKDYTHIVTVGELVGSYAYGYFSSSANEGIGIGSITPTGLFEDNDILYLHNQQTQFTTGAEIYNVHVQLTSGYNKNIYLARSDTKEIYLDGSENPKNWYYTRDKPMLFSPKDVGKEVPIWLANTPPLGLKASNCHLYKEVA